jgi:hypothetical protein
MEKKWVAIIAACSVLLLSSCNNQEPPVESNTPTSTLDNMQGNPEPSVPSAVKDQALLLEENPDWNQDGNTENLSVSASNDNGITITVEYEGEKQAVNIQKNGTAQSSEVIQLDEKTYGIAVKISGNDPNGTINDPVDERFSYLIWAFVDNQLIPVFNGFENNANLNDTYEIKYLGGGEFSLTDKKTEFKVEVKAEVEESDEALFNRIVESNEVMKKQFEPSTWFTSAELIVLNNSMQIDLIKMIPGYDRAHPLGYFQYTFAWAGKEFILQKESFFTASGVMMLEPKVVKEMKF